MKKLAFVAFALVAASASESFANIFDPSYFRCTADQLGGHPSDGITAPSRTGYGRTSWARAAYTYWYHSNQVPHDFAHASRFWHSSYDNDVDLYAMPPPDGENNDLYPVYVNSSVVLGDGSSPLWVGPGPSNMSWFGTTLTQISGLSYTGAHDLPAGIQVDAMCEAGCYSPEQAIRVGDTFVPVVDAHDSGQRAVTTLVPNATLDSPKFMKNQIARWTVDIAPAEQTILTLRMKSGGELRVTTEHPLLTSEGVMKQAQDFVVGESLVRENGSPDPVVSIEKTQEFTKVYNLRPTTTDLTSNILVAQGYLSGSVRYQNEYLKYLNRRLFRDKIPSSVIFRKAAASKRVTTTP
jgi:hypothetical protein